VTSTTAVPKGSSTVPLARMGGPDDVAQACLFLASTGSAYISGANLVLHGGGEWPAYLGALEGPGSG
jgi:NAD(P)-dependent dehydrogenase (short-subunit alcohol dehydrogenase family)